MLENLRDKATILALSLLPVVVPAIAADGTPLTDGLPAPAAKAVSLAEIRESGELVMLCFPHQESPFVSVNTEHGPMPRLGSVEHFEGIDVDLIHAFAEEIGVELMIRPVREPGYGGILPELVEGHGHLAASSLSITEERKRLVDFSDSYFAVYPVVVTRQESSPSSIEDLAGLRAATVKGSRNSARLRKLGVDLEALIEANFLIDAFLAVEEGEADFALLDSAAVPRIDPSILRVAFRLSEEDPYGIAVPKGSDLREHLNRFLAKMKESGRLQEILERHLR